MGHAERTAPPEVRRVVWADSALDDLDSIKAYIGQFNPIAAQRMAQGILTATENVIGLFPEAGRSIGNGCYEFPIVWPYALRYRIRGDDVIILRVRHGARQAED
jgi:plasmid stabilization system protein ParE